MGFFGSINSIFRKIIPTANERELRRLYPILNAINEKESSLVNLSDEELKNSTAEFKQRLENGQPLDELLIDAFAVVREAGKRTVNRHYDVQILGGIILHQGKISEMKTGEGKTLVATLPVYLNALPGKGAHVVTVNDYLAKRDAEWMGRIYNFLGLTVGIIQTTSEQIEHFNAYRCDITYGTNNEFGFDYLRDNMKPDIRYYVQRGHHYAVVDEVDSILIDEARTPLIISGASEESTDLYVRVDKIMPRLTREIDYVIDEKSKTASLTENGITKSEKNLGVDNLYDPQNMLLQHHLNQALRAHTLFKRDVDYVVKDGQICIVDEFTGRLMPGRRWSDGLHQAVEAKEGVKIASENQTLATITFQNYFRMYAKLAGMTGTAQTEAAEFAHIYKLDVVSVPTNKSLIRHEYPDVVYKTEREKFDAVVNEIEEHYTNGRPVLVGTIAIEKSEKLSKMLTRKKIPHNVLNAKHHEREAEIVAQAGRKGAITIATNMAGRGTDILLGGNPDFLTRQYLRSISMEEDNPEYAQMYSDALVRFKEQTQNEHEEVISLGGLHILGTERHESRRIDNQLRGRSGRQGDPGSSRFYISLEDDLMRIFGSERLVGIMDRLGMQEGEPIEHNLISKTIENAQKKVESMHFSARKNLLEYDDVMNKQREVVYSQRADILTKTDYSEQTGEMIEDVLEGMLELHIPAKSHPEEWDMESIEKGLVTQFGFCAPLQHPSEGEYWTEETFFEYLCEEYKNQYKSRKGDIPQDVWLSFERDILLDRIDANWKDHLLNMDHLKEGIGLRGYGQRDPLTEYKREGFELFQSMVTQIKKDSIRGLFFYKPSLQPMPVANKKPVKTLESRGSTLTTGPKSHSDSDGSQQQVHTYKRDAQKVGRNDLCPCGSGKKYKKCCGV